MKLARLFVVAALVASVLSAGPVAAQAQLYCEGHAATIVGTPGNDILIGTKGLQTDRANGRTSWLRHSSTWENAVPTLGYATAGENVAWTDTQRASHLHSTLVASGSHLCNILNPNFDTVGIGATTLEADGPGIIATFMFAGDQSPETGNRFDGQPLRGLETDRAAISCNWR